MDAGKGVNGKKNFLLKTWDRCRSFGNRQPGILSKSKSCNVGGKNNRWRKLRLAPHGCFCVYVGPEKQRFVIKAEYANHPMFRMLLEDAESEYGHNSDGPILLPCDVDFFYRVLSEIDAGEEEDDYGGGCGVGYGSCSPFNPTRRMGNSSMGKGYGSYGILTPSRLIRKN